MKHFGLSFVITRLYHFTVGSQKIFNMLHLLVLIVASGYKGVRRTTHAGVKYNEKNKKSTAI